MEVWKLTKGNRKSILDKAAKALKAGKVVVYPTDTAYALGVLVENPSALKKMYLIKLRDVNKPVHVLVGSLSKAKELVRWNKTAAKLAKAFLPGPLSIALPIKSTKKVYKTLSANTGFLGFRISSDDFSSKLSSLSGVLSATSANPSKERGGGFDPYSAGDVITQFSRRKYKPDIIIDAGRLKKNKPSTFIKIWPNGTFKVLRKGPISLNQIREILL